MFDLTQQERKVILFLLAIAITGAGINFFVKNNPRIKTFVYPDQDIGRININTADKDLLMSARGIGEKLAGRIIDYRSRNNGFGQIEELKNIKGISENKYEKIKQMFVVK